MREIKFRAWDKEAKKLKMVSGLYTMKTDNNLANGDIETDSGCFPSNFGKDVTLMQYTGLKDKNGVEIYEGDVVKYYRGHMPERTVIEDIRNITYMGHEWGNGEVIGNIYENSNLLKEDI